MSLGVMLQLVPLSSIIIVMMATHLQETSVNLGHRQSRGTTDMRRMTGPPKISIAKSETEKSLGTSIAEIGIGTVTGTGKETENARKRGSARELVKSRRLVEGLMIAANREAAIPARNSNLVCASICPLSLQQLLGPGLPVLPPSHPGIHMAILTVTTTRRRVIAEGDIIAAETIPVPINLLTVSSEISKCLSLTGVNVVGTRQRPKIRWPRAERIGVNDEDITVDTETNLLRETSPILQMTLAGPILVNNNGLTGTGRENCGNLPGLVREQDLAMVTEMPRFCSSAQSHPERKKMTDRDESSLSSQRRKGMRLNPRVSSSLRGRFLSLKIPTQSAKALHLSRMRRRMGYPLTLDGPRSVEL
jgi:hypothetical protein